MTSAGSLQGETAADEYLDLRGIPCPQNAGKAVVKLSTMSSGEVLFVQVDDGEPVANVSASVEGEGHKVIRRQREGQSSWKIWIRVDGQNSSEGEA
jgi:TusA-related sulfurtransferase